MGGFLGALFCQLAGLVLLLAGWALITVHAANFWVWLAAAGLALLLWMLTFAPPFWWAFLVVAAWVVPVLMWVHSGWRQSVIVQPAWHRLRKALPPLSETEREALQAGAAGWEEALFTGAPDWDKILRGQPAELTETEQEFLQGPAERLCALLDDWRITTADYDLPPEAWQLIREEKFFGMALPEQYGGLGFSALAHSEVVMKIASRSVAAAVTVMVPNSLGPGKLLLRYGTQEQKDHYLPRLARGEETPCFGLTGPHAGSDAASLQDTGVVCQWEEDGESILGIRLNWEKRYITLAPVATLIGLAFRLYDPDGLLGGARDLGITLALVPADAPGVEVGRRHMPLQVPFMNGPTLGRDVLIPMDQVIGGREGVGRGWQMLMECLGEGRGISLPALAVAAGKLATRRTGAYAAVRRQFSLPIARFEGVEEVLGGIGGNTYLMNAVRTEIARQEDCGECSSVASAIAKQQLTERMRQVVNGAMDINAGAGICVGPRNQVARLYQAVPIAITVEGANLLTRNMIIFGQGLVRCHPYLLQEMECLQMEEEGEVLERFDLILGRHAGTTFRSASRAFVLGLSGGRYPLSDLPPAPYRVLAWQSACFAWVVDMLLLRYGGMLKRRERLSARLADMFSAQYMAVCVIRRFQARGGRPEEIPLRDWALMECRQHFTTALDGLIRNLDNIWLRALLRVSTLPLGRMGQFRADKGDSAVARLITMPGAERDRLCEGIYLGEDPDDPVVRLEQGLIEAEELEPVRRALRRAVQEGKVTAGEDGVDLDQAVEAGVVTSERAEQLREADRRVDEIIAVDAFAPGDWARAAPVLPSGPPDRAAQ